MEFDGAVAIVTGAGRGIGRAIAMRLADAGARVVVADIRIADVNAVVEEIQNTGREAIAMKVDVSDANQVRQMVIEVLNKYKRIDILVNNAGIFQGRPFVEMTEDDWDRMMAINLKSVFLCSRAVIEPMISQGSGCIINISSTAGLTGGTSGAHYAAAKGGVAAFTRSLGKELANKGIRVNAVAPSKIETDMLQGVETPEARDQLISRIPLGRLGKPSDIAEIVAFLASPHASYIIGEVIVASGGY